MPETTQSSAIFGSIDAGFSHARTTDPYRPPEAVPARRLLSVSQIPP
jgi:hypothetical protein